MLVRRVANSQRKRKKKKPEEEILVETMFVLVSTIRGWGNTDLFSRAIQHVLRPYFEGDEFYNRKWDL